METLKLKKLDWVLVAIVIVIILVIAITAINAKREQDDAKQKEGEKRDRLAEFIQRWQDLINQIKIEIQTLKLTQEMEAMVERKIATYLLLAKIVLAVIFVSVVGLFYVSGVDIVTAAINTTGILTIVFFGGSLLILTKFTDPNSAVESFVGWVRKTVCKKYGYDPVLIPALKESIALKHSEAQELNILIQDTERSLSK